MNDQKTQFEKYIHEALVNLAERAEKISAQIECNINSNFMDDCIDEYYIEFDSYERPINYPKLGKTGIEEWKDICIHAPKIFYCVPNEQYHDEACYYLDYGDETRHWFYIDEVITELETTCAKFNDLIYCHRFTFKANLKYIKETDEHIA